MIDIQHFIDSLNYQSTQIPSSVIVDVNHRCRDTLASNKNFSELLAFGPMVFEAMSKVILYITISNCCGRVDGKLYLYAIPFLWVFMSPKRGAMERLIDAHGGKAQVQQVSFQGTENPIPKIAQCLVTLFNRIPKEWHRDYSSFDDVTRHINTIIMDRFPTLREKLVIILHGNRKQGIPLDFLYPVIRNLFLGTLALRQLHMFCITKGLARDM